VPGARAVARARLIDRLSPPAASIACAAAMLAGAVLALAQPALPASLAMPFIALLALFGWLVPGPQRVPTALLLGFAWTCVCADAALQLRLPERLQENDHVLVVRVVGLPIAHAAHRRFDVRVEEGEGEAAELAGRRLRLSWYGAAPDLLPGSRWRLLLRLKRPRGLVNPGGFDHERYALEQRLAATGYVRESPGNRELAPGSGIDLLRLRLSLTIAEAIAAPRARFVQALAVGDTRALDEHDWEVLRATGIAHLIAISGLHVGLVAGFGALLTGLLYRVWPRVGLRLPLPQAAAIAGLLAAGAYAALAGFALPTVRTVSMIAAVLIAVLLRRRIGSWQAFSLALLAALAVDPLSVLGAGFWLSFLGVAWLLWCLPRDARAAPLRTLISAQGVMTVSLLPLTVWFFGQASVVGPFANLVAVPWVSFVTVPLALAGTSLALLYEPLGTPFFVASAWTMQWLWSALEPAAGVSGALVYLPQPDRLAFALALLGAFWLLLPRAIPGKGLALLLFAPLLWPQRVPIDAGTVEVWMFDVGQGLSVLVRTREHALLYDAGPGFAGGFDLGEAAVLPALRALGVARLDAYVESHGDNDHAGGSASVLHAYTPGRVLASDPRREGARPCVAGDQWAWDGVHFEILHPPRDFPYLKNDSSCVLRIDAGGQAVLLAGDIGELIEARLLRERRERLDAGVLVVPHHGSRTSSSPAFVAAVDAEVALIGVGHRNRFGLPRAEVVQRYADEGAAVLDTAGSGAIRLRLGGGEMPTPLRWREVDPRVWRER
jgi:competence protein ComEC